MDGNGWPGMSWSVDGATLSTAIQPKQSLKLLSKNIQISMDVAKDSGQTAGHQNQIMLFGHGFFAFRPVQTPEHSPVETALNSGISHTSPGKSPKIHQPD